MGVASLIVVQRPKTSLAKEKETKPKVKKELVSPGSSLVDLFYNLRLMTHRKCLFALSLPFGEKAGGTDLHKLHITSATTAPVVCTTYP